MFQIFKKKTVKKQSAVRRFAGAKNSALTNFQTSYNRINSELKSDYIALVLRARELAKNNQIVKSYINLMIRNVIGSQGFTLKVTCYSDDNFTADISANQTIENLWYDYCNNYKKYISADKKHNALDFDKLILQTLLIDGQVFLRKIYDQKSPYCIRYALIDSLDVDINHNQIQEDSAGNKIVMGIKIDSNNTPVSYYIRKNKNTDYYLSGDLQEVPADQIIHIYKQQFANQIRGITPLSAVIQPLNSLEEYKKAEINSSLLSACYMGIWEKNGSADSYQNYDEDQISNQGDVAVEIQQGSFRYAPQGYTLKSIQSNHPNSNLGAFIKAVIKGIASSLGVSSNKLNSDYQSVNYSSLRQANQQDIASWKQLQQFIIDNWKDIQYSEFLKQILLSDLTNLKYSKLDKYMVHSFFGKSWQYLDPVKEFSAIKLKLEMKLTNPIIQIEKNGYDVDDLLNGWALWERKLKEKNLKIEQTENILESVFLDDNQEQELDDLNKDKNKE